MSTHVSSSVLFQSVTKTSKMSMKKSRRKKGGRLQRLTSNVFAMFNQAQIQEFKVRREYEP